MVAAVALIIECAWYKSRKILPGFRNGGSPNSVVGVQGTMYVLCRGESTVTCTAYRVFPAPTTGLWVPPFIQFRELWGGIMHKEKNFVHGTHGLFAATLSFRIVAERGEIPPLTPAAIASLVPPGLPGLRDRFRDRDREILPPAPVSPLFP
mgnify:CR=1 FL=1